MKANKHRKIVLETSENIVDSLFKNGQSVGTLLLNESSITPKEWEKIVKLVGVE